MRQIARLASFADLVIDVGKRAARPGAAADRLTAAQRVVPVLHSALERLGGPTLEREGVVPLLLVFKKPSDAGDADHTMVVE